MWNLYRIRVERDIVFLDGVLDYIYNFFEKYGFEECGMCYIILCFINECIMWI